MEGAVANDQSVPGLPLIGFSDQTGRKSGCAHITDHALGGRRSAHD
jgi:hypothetical protein